MQALTILRFPNKLLRIKTSNIVEITDEIKNLADDMAYTMYLSNGIGLAANQVGNDKSIIVIADKLNKQNQLLTMINPSIDEASGTQISFEGCLSFPGIKNIAIQRPKSLLVRFLDKDGKECALEAEDLLAACISHEYDHLNGKTLFDYVSDFRKKKLLKQLKSI